MKRLWGGGKGNRPSSHRYTFLPQQLGPEKEKKKSKKQEVKGKKERKEGKKGKGGGNGASQELILCRRLLQEKTGKKEGQNEGEKKREEEKRSPHFFFKPRINAKGDGKRGKKT